jgi:hypothetical protein
MLRIASGPFVNADSILVRDNEPVCATVQGDLVLLSVRAGAYFKFNSVGARIWDMLGERRKVSEIFAAFAQSHSIDHDIVIRDVGRFLEMLVQRQLVRVVASDDAA